MNKIIFKTLWIILLFYCFTNPLFAQAQETAIQNTQTQHIKVGLLTTHPFVYVKDNSYTGLAFDIWEEISNLNHFQSEYIDAGENIPLAIQKLANGEFDILVGNIGIYSERLKKGYYTLPFLRDEYVILAKKNNQNFFEIYDLLLGGHALLIIFLIIFVYFLYINLFWFYERHYYPEIPQKNYLNGISFLFWKSSLNRFYHPVYPTIMITRIISLIWRTVLIYIIFSIISVLTSTFLNKLQNRDQLFLSANKLKNKTILLVGGEAAEKVAQESKLNITQKTGNINNAISMLEKNNIDAIFTFYSYANTYIQENPNSNLYISPIKFPNFQSGIMVNFKNKNLLYPINMALLEMSENGKKSELCKNYEKYIKYESCFWY